MCKCPAVARGGGEWAQLELTDALLRSAPPGQKLTFRIPEKVSVARVMTSLVEVADRL